MPKKIQPIARKSKLVVQELKNELLVYDLEINKAFCLNKTSALIFGLCDGTKTVVEIGRQLSREIKTEVPEDFVWLAVAQLKKEGLLENADEIPLHSAGLSRREIAKRVGLATMAAFPAISSIVAPAAAQAASTTLLPNGTPVGSTLVFPGTCATVPVSTLDSQCNQAYGKLCLSGKAAYAGNCFNTGGPLGVSFSCVCTA